MSSQVAAVFSAEEILSLSTVAVSITTWLPSRWQTTVATTVLPAFSAFFASAIAALSAAGAGPFSRWKNATVWRKDLRFAL